MSEIDQVGISFLVTTAVILTVFDVCLAFTNSWIGASGRTEGEIADAAERFFPRKNLRGWLIAWFMIFSGVILALSTATCPLWAERLRLGAVCTVSLWGAPPQTAIFQVLLLQGILCVILTYKTGGAAISPYPSGLLLVPTLGVFLQVAPSLILVLALFSLIAFWALHIVPRSEERVRNAGAVGFLSGACFVLSMLTAFASMQITQ